MQIKHQALAAHLRSQLAGVYVLLGPDPYFLQEACDSILLVARLPGACDEQRISLESTTDWQQVVACANTYSLFYDNLLIQAEYLKKTLDAAAKDILSGYLQAINPLCTLIIKAPLLNAKQLSWLSNHPAVVVVQSYPLAESAMKPWIAAQLQKRKLAFEAEVVNLLYQYTQGNTLACAQAIEKMSLTQEPNTPISKEQALMHLSFQCDHALFELSEACLLGKAALAIQIIRQAQQSKTEASLVLWVLCTEIRLLLQLKEGSSELKIPAFRQRLYPTCLKRLGDTAEAFLLSLLLQCQQLDEAIKSRPQLPWQLLEGLALALCLGPTLGANPWKA